ncbi:hypothetical protein D3C85_876090 [compost metagenome]
MVAAGARIAAEQAEQPVGEGRAGRPGLLAVEHVMVAVENRLAGDRRHVRAGIGLRPALRPHISTGCHTGQEALFLRRGTKLHQRRSEQQLTVLVDPHRRTGAVVLFLEDQPLDQIAAAPAKLGRPHHHRQAIGEQLRLPGAVLLEALAGVVVGQRLARQVGRQPGTHFLTESSLFRGIGKFHGRSLRTLRRVFRRRRGGFPRNPDWCRPAG